MQCQSQTFIVSLGYILFFIIIIILEKERSRVAFNKMRCPLCLYTQPSLVAVTMKGQHH